MITHYLLDLRGIIDTLEDGCTLSGDLSFIRPGAEESQPHVLSRASFQRYAETLTTNEDVRASIASVMHDSTLPCR